MQRQYGRPWGNDSGSPGVHIACKAISDQGIGEFGENLPYPMVTWLVKEIQSWVIGNVDCWLAWILQPATQRNCDEELGSKGQVESLRPDMPIIMQGLFSLPDQVAKEGSHIW